MRSTVKRLAPALANALLAGEWTADGLEAALADAFGVRAPELSVIAREVVQAYPAPPHHARDRLAATLVETEALATLILQRQIHRLQHFPVVPARMAPGVRWPVRRIDTRADLARWLGLSHAQLDWFADRKALERLPRDPRLQHYQYRWVEKPSGPPRLLEAPKQRLKSVQRKILAEILEALPPHDAAHGFRAGRSVLTHARLHTGQQTVVRFDLEAFFAHVPLGRVLRLFEAAGYEEQVARSLTGLCTNTAPQALLHARLRPRTAHDVQPFFRLRQKLSGFHLPQGAPTSPALANLCAFGLDVRLTAAANRWGLVYSRYADDLTFSGDLRSARALERTVAEIARDEGFSLNRAKTRAMSRARRQQVTGVVVNDGVNVGRREHDALKALLHNCRTEGVASQRRELPAAQFRARVLGRIGWVEQLSPRRGERLRRMFDGIDWSEGARQ